MDSDTERRIEEGTIGQAYLSFVEYDWEIGNQQGWFLSVNVPRVQLQTLIEAFGSKDVTSLAMGFVLKRAYVTEWHATPRDRICWYVIPDKYGAHRVRGTVSYINFETQSLNFGKENVKGSEQHVPDKDIESLSDPIAEEAAQTLAKIANDLGRIATTLDGLKGHLWWLFWAVVAVAAFSHWR